ncbi:MAG: LacI family DNA-binding transcriptional regulator [Streptosporangiaceae bacterium]
MTTQPVSRRTTARDVAERAGCSASTVSLVFTGKDAGRVSPQLRGLILAAAADLGYRVNSTASALARGQLESIGLVGPDPTNPFFSMVLEGLTRNLDRAFSLTVLMPEGGENYSLATVQRALAGNLAGLILASPGTEFLESFVPTCPTVILDAGGKAGAMPSVDLDLHSAVRELSGYLASLGHHRVAYVGVSREKKVSLQYRREELQAGLLEHGAGLAVDDLLLEGMTIGDAFEGFQRIWPAWSAAGVTAVVCGDDLHAYGVLKAARPLGLDIPGDLSLVGFNDLPYSELTAPALSTVNLFATRLGTEAAALLGAYIRTGRAPRSKVLPSALVIRESGGPVRRGGPRAGR